jgi:hypothetical protein
VRAGPGLRALLSCRNARKFNARLIPGALSSDRRLALLCSSKKGLRIHLGAEVDSRECKNMCL